MRACKYLQDYPGGVMTAAYEQKCRSWQCCGEISDSPDFELIALLHEQGSMTAE